METEILAYSSLIFSKKNLAVFAMNKIFVIACSLGSHTNCKMGIVVNYYFSLGLNEGSFCSGSEFNLLMICTCQCEATWWS